MSAIIMKRLEGRARDPELNTQMVNLQSRVAEISEAHGSRNLQGANSSTQQVIRLEQGGREPAHNGSQGRDAGSSNHSSIEQGPTPLPHAGQSSPDPPTPSERER